MHLTLQKNRPGYIFLVTALMAGAIAMTTTISLLLLGLAAVRSSYSFQTSVQALAYAQACAERALLELRKNDEYVGENDITFSLGSCSIFTDGKEGNDNRSICIEASSGQSIRRLEISIRHILETTSIDTYKEVSSFSLCDVS